MVYDFLVVLGYPPDFSAVTKDGLEAPFLSISSKLIEVFESEALYSSCISVIVSFIIVVIIFVALLDFSSPDERSDESPSVN